MIVIEILLGIAAAWGLYVHVRMVRAIRRNDPKFPHYVAIHADLLLIALILALGFIGLLSK